MTWVAVGVAAAGATVNYMNNQAAKKREQANMEANAEAIRYSPWSGMKTQMMGHTAGTSDMAAILGGGLQGAAFAQQFKKAPAPDGGGGGGETPIQPANVGDDYAKQQSAAMSGSPELGGPNAMELGSGMREGMTGSDYQDLQHLQAPGLVGQNGRVPVQSGVPRAPAQAPVPSTANAVPTALSVNNPIVQPGSPWSTMIFDPSKKQTMFNR